MTYSLRRMPLDWQAPSPPAPVVWQAQEASEGERDTTVEFFWAGETARHVGNVVHQFLQQIAEEGLEAWDDTRIEARAALARRHCNMRG